MRYVIAMTLLVTTACVEQNRSASPDAATAEDSTVPSDASSAVPSDASTDAVVAQDAVQPIDSTVSPDAQSRPTCIVVPNPDACDPNPPHNDPVGQVCANDGTPEEAYCMFDGNGAMVCARSENGGPCQNGDAPVPEMDAGLTPDAGPDLPGVGTFPIRPIDAADPLARFFSQEAGVFGVRLVATAQVPRAKLSHAATVMAEYLDNNEDGDPDDPAVVQAMRNHRALLVMFAHSAELEGSGIFETRVLDGYWGQDLQADETNVPGRFDATLEEVLHLISTSGYATEYPDALGIGPGTLLTDAMDLARGGRFNSVPARYPDGSWYHYDDQTCDYRCMATEYFYWALTTHLGGQDGPGRCAEIAREWEPCTAEQLEARDPAIHRLLTDPQYKLPSVLPDGVYGG